MRTALLFFLLAGLTPLQAKEISADQLPAVVKQALRKLHPSAQIKEVESTHEYGEPLFEIELKEDNQEYEIYYHTDGSLFGYEYDIPLGLVPKSIRQDALRRLSGSRIVEAEVVANPEGEPLAYELEIKTQDGNHWDLYYNADGSFIEKTKD